MDSTSSPSSFKRLLHRDTEEQPQHHAHHGSEERDGHRLQPDDPTQLRSHHPHRPEQPDLPGPLEHRQGQGVDDAEDRDDDGQAEQCVQDVQQDVELALLVLDVLRLGLRPSRSRTARSTCSEPAFTELDVLPSAVTTAMAKSIRWLAGTALSYQARGMTSPPSSWSLV